MLKVYNLLCSVEIFTAEAGIKDFPEGSSIFMSGK